MTTLYAWGRCICLAVGCLLSDCLSICLSSAYLTAAVATRASGASPHATFIKNIFRGSIGQKDICAYHNYYISIHM